ncbi:unnamed protein product [Bemisia tabaci]|uniref:F5/8 type C domain-containing protein n=1 Tax=Bemisia tabaci TaxID=7038 RepID=A0A9P0ADI5_BEMTA|nr:unnamed protein product [Bemisia tabaci]
MHQRRARFSSLENSYALKMHMAHYCKTTSDSRIRSEILGGAWCPKQQITTESREWLEIDLHSVHVITAAETQGRFGNGQGQEFAEAYLIEYWRPKLGKWVRYRDVKGNEQVTEY